MPRIISASPVRRNGISYVGRLLAVLVVSVIALFARPAHGHEKPDTVRVKVGEMTTFSVKDAGDCKATIWIDRIEHPDLATITPSEGFGIEVEFTVNAGATPGVTTIVVQWKGEHVDMDEGHCKEDTQPAGVEIVLRVTPEFVNSSADAEDYIPGDGHCDTGSNIDRGGREEPRCTLRAAIQEANAGSISEITFDIPGSAPYVIRPKSALPAVEQPVTLSGPAPGAKGATTPAPQIVLDGRTAGGTASGLTIAAGARGAKIEHLIVIGFGGSGIVIQTDDVVVTHCFVGTDAEGASGVGNGGSGILIESRLQNTIGGEDESKRNIISGNSRYGVEIKNGSQNRIIGNWIGISPDSTRAVANKKGGVFVSGANNTIGGRSAAPGQAPGNVITGNEDEGGVVVDGGENFVRGNVIGAKEFSNEQTTEAITNKGPGVTIQGSGNVIGGQEEEANVIAGNDSTGVLVKGGNTHVAIRRNSIFANGGLGIDLLPGGPAENDSTDSDSGPNGLLNYPQVDSVTYPDPFVTGSPVTVYGSFRSRPNASYEIDLFVSDECDDSRYGEGQFYAETGQAATGADGRATFSIVFNSEGDLTYDSSKKLTLTATDADGSTSEFSQCTRRQYRIVDVFRNPIKEKAFAFVRVEENPPFYSETLVDSLTTDEDGLIDADSVDFAHNEFLKVTRRVDSVPSPKRSHAPYNAYRVDIDNGWFSDRNYDLLFDRVDTTKLVQDIVLDHTTFAYNLVVSVEWDATQQYLSGVQESFRLASNYLYDVTDGQARFDTVAIFKNGDVWDTADLQIHANNVKWPSARVHGLETLGSDQKMHMPRRWFGNEKDGRNLSVTENPLNQTASKHYRTIAHEFGHYGFGFYDEYLYRQADGRFVADASLRCGMPANVGFMQRHYESGGIASSEMSWSRSYADAACRNTKQYAKRGESTWDYFETKMQKERDGIYARIQQPKERALPDGFDYFRGPNIASNQLDYNVGQLVKFPIAAPIATRGNKIIRVEGLLGDPLPNIEVTQTIGDRTIVQGKSSDAGRVNILGIADSDELSAEGLFNSVENLNKRISEPEWYSATVAAAEDAIVLRPVAGLKPALVQAQPNGNTITLRVTPTAEFPSVPKVTLFTEGRTQTLTFTPTAEGYEVNVPFDAVEGRLRTSAVDDSSRSFFFTTKYNRFDLAQSDFPVELTGPDGEVEISVDTSAAENETLLLISSPYPPLRTGLPDGTLQAGLTHTLALDPVPADDGERKTAVTLRYSDIQLPSNEDEATLRVFRWDDSDGWVVVGGVVDTVENKVTASVPGSGTFAAFTTTIDTSSDEDDVGHDVPQRFQLYSAYPNPFNPVTRIPYDVAAASTVRLTVYDVLGRQIAVLVDESRAPGRYEAVFDASSLPSGRYFLRIVMNNYTAVKSVLLVK